MSGSMRWFKYADDNGDLFALYLDESNTETVNLVDDIGQVGIGSLKVLPSNIKPRFVRLQNTSGTVKRKAVVLTQERFAALNGGIDFLLSAVAGAESDGGTTVNVTSKSGERVTRLPKLGDTGKTDGDVP